MRSPCQLVEGRLGETIAEASEWPGQQTCINLEVCGIIGYVGPRECRDLLLEGLQRLEYRGYDSAGLSLVTNGSIGSVHAVGTFSTSATRWRSERRTCAAPPASATRAGPPTAG